MIEQIIKNGLVNPENIDALLNYNKQQNVKTVFIDASYALPTQNINVTENYIAEHIENARFFEIDTIASLNTDLPHMLPDLETFNLAMGKMGIRNDDFLIIYGQSGLIMGPARVWWTFKVFGHARCVILNGGLPAWKKQNLETQSGSAPVFPQTHYTASAPNKQMVCDAAQVLEISKNKTCPILDARPATRFHAQSPEPRAHLNKGHIPASLNIPANSLIDENTGFLKRKEDLQKIFQNNGINLDTNPPKQIITTCGSGVTACVIAFALFHLGYQSFCVYDGSWCEWGDPKNNLPVAAE